MKDRRQYILDTVSDLVGAFLYYDRKEDKDLPRGAIQEAIRAGEISVDEIIDAFREDFERGAKP